jgi:hypothetical protein
MFVLDRVESDIARVADGSTGGFGSHCCSLGSSCGWVRHYQAERGLVRNGWVRQG